MASPQRLSREEVILGYRLLLGRPPESEAVIAAHAAAHAGPEGFGLALAASPEFLARTGRAPGLPPPLDVPPLEIETDATPAQMEALLRHLSAYWNGVGEEAAHWSVITEDRFRPEQLPAHEAAFYASGAAELALVEAVLARLGRGLGGVAHAVEHGCGVGRVSVHLAARVGRFTGLDISAAHLRLARAALDARGLGAAALARVTAEELMPAAGYDLWFSRIVLQHNPPPLIMATLGRAFAGLRPGGAAIFQVPVHVTGYRFRIADYLAAAPGRAMEQHVVPQRAVLELAERHGCALRDLREDNALLERPGEGVSNTMAFVKREDAPCPA